MNIIKTTKAYILPLAFVFSQYSNILIIFLVSIMVATTTTINLAAYGLCMTIYTVFTRLLYGILASIGIWITHALRQDDREQITIILIYGLTFSIIVSFFLMFILTSPLILKSLITNKMVYSGVKEYYMGFILGIPANVLIMYFIQISSAFDQGSLIFKITILNSLY